MNHSKIYVIPDNFIGGAKVWQGMVSLRNLIEGIVMALCCAVIVAGLPLTYDLKITACIVAGLPALGLGVVGINGDPVSVWIYHFYQWLMKRRIMLYNVHTRCYSLPIAEMMLTMERPVDTIGDWITELKKKLGLDKARTEDMLIEGRDFVFDSADEDSYANTKRIPNYLEDSGKYGNVGRSTVNFDD